MRPRDENSTRVILPGLRALVVVRPADAVPVVYARPTLVVFMWWLSLGSSEGRENRSGCDHERREYAA
ncbi:hypothetical protein [Mycobacterium marinum]|uniref:hypothetical protein n=1 Tax=Mycobacterium marinum TaxID=1781 RepID=UPI003566FB91